MSTSEGHWSLGEHSHQNILYVRRLDSLQLVLVFLPPAQPVDFSFITQPFF
ncbi:hypothetical protein TYRP_002944, partial [Tyrophagus putrescentiae]